MSRKLFAEEVVNFSSQYGTANTQSYTADNLKGGLKVYDRYGDFQEAFVLRTYGPWWQRCPSARKKFQQNVSFRSQDFVELRYNTALIPTEIKIYETYHPGAVVRILACNADPKNKTKPGEVEWVTLWSGPPQCSQLPKRSRIFSPPLKKIDFPTSLIRLEFNSKECEYYTELDAVELVGDKPSVIKAIKDRAEGFQVALTTRLIRQLSLSDRQTSVGSDDEDYDKWGYFGMLTDEVIQTIFEYLDVASLCNVAQTCTLLLKNAYDPFLYRELNLQPHWNTVDDVALEGLMSRCGNIMHLDLSWTGGGGQITEDFFCIFLEECGENLVTLRLACCQYIGEESMAMIGRVCKNLEELDLQSCLQLKEAALVHIEKLTQLKRLNLYSMDITKEVLYAISKCLLMKHLNIGASLQEGSGAYGVVSRHSTRSCEGALRQCISQLKNLVSLDLWRCKFADQETIETIAEHCPHLEELDIGWCHRIYRQSGALYDLFPKCQKLRKLFLTCGRTIDDGHLVSISKHCKDLEQIDILGTNSITMEGTMALCKGCPKLFFFDLSFCGKLKNDDVQQLQRLYPNVSFKKSFSE